MKNAASQNEFPTDIESILDRVESVDPVKYARTRNFVDGAVTRLSPYISRGVISTKYVLERTLARGYDPQHIVKFIQELAWREYYQRVWQAKGDAINKDLKNIQSDVRNSQISTAILNAETGIIAIDGAISGLYETGYMHNHARMYVAALACNFAKSHWNVPARWMYYHLLDGDWASNAISWQWVAGAASSKKYFANQENIDRYFYTKQRGTFLDVEYSDFDSMEIPTELRQTEIPELKTALPNSEELKIDNSITTLIYNSYNLDPTWKLDVRANRILLLEPSHFEKYPASQKVIGFLIELATNIDGIQVFVGEFAELIERHDPLDIYYKEHLLNRHYNGTEEDRDWMFSVRGYFPSFFGYWKKCERTLSGSQGSFEF